MIYLSAAVKLLDPMAGWRHYLAVLDGVAPATAAQSAEVKCSQPTARRVGPRDDESCVQHGGGTPLQKGVVWRKCGFILGQPWMGIGEHPSMGIGEEEERATGERR